MHTQRPAAHRADTILALVLALSGLLVTGCGVTIVPGPAAPSTDPSASASPSPATTGPLSPTSSTSPTSTPATTSTSATSSTTPTPVPRPIRIEIKRAYAVPQWGAFVSGRVVDTQDPGKPHKLEMRDAADKLLTGTDPNPQIRNEVTYPTTVKGQPASTERGFELWQRSGGSQPIQKVGDRVVVKVYSPDGKTVVASGPVQLSAWPDDQQKADCIAIRKDLLVAMQNYNRELDKSATGGRDRKILDAGWFEELLRLGYITHIPDDPGAGPASSANFHEADSLPTASTTSLNCVRHGKME